MIRTAFVLSVAMVGCALSLVTSRYELRTTVVQLERARQDERDLDVEWRQLQLDLTDYAQHARIDAAARQALELKPVEHDRRLYIRPGGQVATPISGATP
ncbi:cell division protein FtsL [Achromobacter sp. GG226]|uniref:cell division protein FtsL n=1 Tax=Verticiella alkaliphila TaxID=2779529 RepID=UPI001C0C97C2|nr:cell division protein FtsL [Verticiella sp. GG226]MBU4612067.1 cell division protein FtsL [Verticiella sp. GG226]